MKYLVMALLLVACSKSVDQAPVAQRNDNVLESSFLVRDLNGTLLSITLEPNVVCYSYKDGEAARPCDIFVYATVHLSKPLTDELHIELRRETSAGTDDVVLVIAPNSVNAILNTGFSNQDNLNVPDNVRIRKITMVPFKD